MLIWFWLLNGCSPSASSYFLFYLYSWTRSVVEYRHTANVKPLYFVCWIKCCLAGSIWEEGVEDKISRLIRLVVVVVVWGSSLSLVTIYKPDASIGSLFTTLNYFFLFLVVKWQHRHEPILIIITIIMIQIETNNNNRIDEFSWRLIAPLILLPLLMQVSNN